jgi:restriction system protein
MELLALTPRQFERAVADLLHDLGYRRVEIVGKSGDLAADLLAVDQNGRTVAVQCKRYAPGTKIGSPEIQKFIGMVTVHHRVDRGIFVTTTQFSEPTRSLAEQHSLELFDGSRLSATLATLADRRQRLA